MRIPWSLLFRLRVTFLAVVVVSVVSARAEGQLGAAVANWTVPSSGASARQAGGLTTMGDVTSPTPFIGVTPCRIVDTRGAAGPFGGPSLSAGVARNFALLSGPCTGLPAAVGSYSLNITVTNTLGPGFILIYPQGGSAPVVSTLNYLAGQTVANAAIVPAGTGGGITVVAGVSGTDLIIDINGYFAPTPATGTNYFSVINSGLYAIYGETSNPGAFAAGVYGRATAGPAQGVFGETLSTADGSVGVFGRATPSVGNNAGVAGQTNSATDGAAGVFGTASATTGQTIGVGGATRSTTDNASGVFGNAKGASGATHGVFGQTLSSTDRTTGVLGQAKSTTGQVIGVAGTSASLSNGWGVAGGLVDAGGNLTVYGVLGSATGVAADVTGPPWGVFAFGNSGATGSKHFVEPHATDPSKVILYSSLEGREVGTYFRGTSRIVNHQAVIEVPEDFRMVTDEEGLTVQLTPVGDLATLAVVSQDLNHIAVKASKDVTFHYLVQGVRRAFKDLQPVRIGYEFVPRSPADTPQPFLTPEARRRLIANGTYNADGTVNMATAERMGWAKVWREDAANRRAAPLARPQTGPERSAEK
jgi:hypothetical protein